MAVEAVDVVVSALTAGAATGMKETATTAVKDAYASLVAALGHWLGHERAEEVVSIAEERPADRDGRREELLAAMTAARGGYG